MPGKKFVPIRQRIQERVTIDSATGCWNWIGAKDKGGYGRINVNARSCLVHRVSYEAFKGPIASGLFLDHLCRNTSCCNPDHLEPVTNAENILRGVKKQRQTHCKNGHPLSGDNMLVVSFKLRADGTPSPRRVCLKCSRLFKREHWRRKHGQNIAYRSNAN